MYAKILTALIIFLSPLTGCNFLKNYTPDNPTEQFIEKVIEKQTGIEIDLSPWEVKSGKVPNPTDVEKTSLRSSNGSLLAPAQPCF